MKPSYLYKAFDLYFESDDIDLSDLNQLYRINKNDRKIIKIIKDDLFFNKYKRLLSSGEFYNNLGDNFVININNSLYFSINEDKVIWGTNKIYKADKNYIKAYLLGSVTATILLQRGRLVLHGNALHKNGRTIACLGPSGAGKSTLAYFLIKHGWNLISDDLLAINKNGEVYPGINRIKIDRGLIDFLKINESNLIYQGKEIKKYCLKKSFIPYCSFKTKINQIYIIHKNREPFKLNSKRIFDVPNQKNENLLLRFNTFRPDLIKSLKIESEFFKELVNLQKKVDIKVIKLPSSLDQIDEFINNINL